MPVSNNITRFLDSRNIAYKLYELTPEKRSAAEIAGILNVDAGMVYKSIVLTRQKKKRNILAVVSGINEVDLKKVAFWIGEKKVFLPTEQEAENLSGYQVGGISPLALFNKGFQVILDEDSQLIEEIIISGGQRGLQIQLPVGSLVNLTGALVVPISREIQPLGS